jgi:hypothetical protein
MAVTYLSVAASVKFGQHLI